MAQEAKQSVFTTFGTLFQGRNVNVREAFEEAGLNYPVETQDIVRFPQEAMAEIKSAVAEGRPIDMTGIDWIPSANNIITSHKATFRDDDYNITLGVVGKGYGVVPNTAAFGFIDFLGEVSGREPEIISAGALGYGERMFVTCKIGDDLLLSDRDIITPYVVFTTSHDGSGSVCALVTPVRVICQNTLNMALKTAQHKITCKHTSKAMERLDFTKDENRERAYKVFAGTNCFNEKFLNAMIDLKRKAIGDEYVKTFIGKMLKIKDDDMTLWRKANYNTDLMVNDKVFSKVKARQIEELTYSIYDGIGQMPEYEGTALSLLMGVTTWQQNHNTLRVKEGEADFLNKFEGGAADYAQRAYDYLRITA